MDAKIIGQHIKEYRKKNKLSQKDFGDMLFVSNKAVSRWETGVGFPDINLLPEIAKILGISVNELIGDDESTFIAFSQEKEAQSKKIESVNLDDSYIVEQAEGVFEAPLVVKTEEEERSSNKSDFEGAQVHNTYFPKRALKISAILLSIVISFSIIGWLITRIVHWTSPENTYIFEAEDAIFTNSFVIEDVPHASGGKVVAWMHTPNTSLTVKVYSTETTEVNMQLFVNRTFAFNFEDKLSMEVNGRKVIIGDVPAIAMDGNAYIFYNYSQPIEKTISLRRGENIISLTIFQGLNFNVDCFRFISKARLTLMNKHLAFEAEKAIVDGDYKIKYSDRASNKQYLSELTAGGKVQFTIESPEEASLSLHIYVNRPFGEELEKRLRLHVNGEAVLVGYKDGMGVEMEDDRYCSFEDPYIAVINLHKGTNVISFDVVSSVNFDKIAFNTSLKLTSK